MSDQEQVLGDYVLLEEVGRGSHSVVRRGRRRDRSGRIVAVKRLRADAGPGALDGMRREADTLASLAHPAIVPLLEVLTDADGGVALVLPWAPGGSLEDVLQRQGALPWPRVADIGARLASALASAHGAGILHGDVKPANVLLGVEDEPRLADFGTARLRTEGDDEVVGTAEYVDPAVVVDGVAPSPRSDGYSLGVVLYRALSGQLPHAGGSPAATVAAADRGVHPRLADLVDDAPAELVAAIERAMARDPGQRFGSAQQLQVALEPLVRDDETARWGALAGQLGGAPPLPDDDPPPTCTADTSPTEPPPTSDSGTRLFGPRPPASPPPATRSRPAWAIPAVVAVALVPLVLLAWLLRPDGGAAPDPAASASTPADALVPRRPAPRCEQAEAPGDGGQVLEADVDGRGCALPLVVAEEVVDGEPAVVLAVPEAAGAPSGRYAVGAPGDRVVVGDWDCDGSDTPAVHRPEDGRVFLYDGYGPLEPTAGPRLDPGVEPSVRTDADGCDVVVPAEP